MSVVDDLIREEGFVAHAYLDSLGYLTIGFGTLIDVKKGGGITREEGMYLLKNRVAKFEADLRGALPWFSALDEPRQSALVQMAYQMGVDGVLRFTKMLVHLKAGDYPEAADEALRSKWAEQTPTRAYRVAKLIRDGE